LASLLQVFQYDIFAEHIFCDSKCVQLPEQSIQRVFNAWKNSTGMHENGHCTYIRK